MPRIIRAAGKNKKKNATNAVHKWNLTLPTAVLTDLWDNYLLPGPVCVTALWMQLQRGDVSDSVPAGLFQSTQIILNGHIGVQSAGRTTDRPRARSRSLFNANGYDVSEWQHLNEISIIR